MTSPIGRRLNRARHTPLDIKKKVLASLAGYTLIELILLAIIISVLVGISTPLFRKTFSDLELRNVSFNIAKLIGFAQEKSIVEGALYKLVLDSDKARYYIERSDPATPGNYARLKERFGRVFSLPQGITLKSDKKEIVFYPDGHSDKAVITFSGKDKGLNVKVKGNLGYVEIEDKRRK